MNLDALRKSLVMHEGWRNLPYEDHLGNLTLGVGHLLSNPISEAAINQILTDDIDTAVTALDRSFKGWRNHDDVRQNVLVSMMFNLGPSRLAGFKNMWAALQKKDYLEAARHMLDSQWAKQVKGRAYELAEQMERGKL